MSSVSKKCLLLLWAHLMLVVPLLTKMINLSFQQGQVPESGKAALIRPLINKLGLELVNNARTSGQLVICLLTPN